MSEIVTDLRGRIRPLSLEEALHLYLDLIDFVATHSVAHRL